MDTEQPDERAERQRMTQQAGERLRRMRQDRELSLRDVEQATGVSVSQLSRIELGRIVPNVFQAVTLARYYGTWPVMIWGEGYTEAQAAAVAAAVADALAEPDDDAGGGALRSMLLSLAGSVLMAFGG